jgi:uncharacterized protein DUF1553/uncharacterized protein DUF1549
MNRRVLPASCRQKKLGSAGKMPAARSSHGAMNHWGLLAVLAIMQVLAGSAAARDNSKEPSFATRILPLLTKAGCNAGACHGAATGQGGFKLSLLGYDPEQDHDTITRELSGRRVDLGAPEQSLLLRKPTRQLEHEGGRRFPRDSQAYRTLLNWIASGAPYGARDVRVTGIHVAPADVLLLKPGQSRPLKVTARLTDGTAEDVTSLALYSSNDDGVADVDGNGVVTVRNRGLTAVMIRYSGQVAAARVGAPYQDGDVAAISFPVQNFIDQLVLAELKRLRITPSPLCDDATFLRRVHLDVVGGLPTPAEVRAFVDRPASARKRRQVIDQLLVNSEFVDFWTLKLADLLLINSKKLGNEGTQAYHAWLRRQVKDGAPLDRAVRELLMAQGDPAANGPANFHRLTTDPRDLGEFVSQAFLGTRVACARCHNHPFDRWTQDDYYHFAAFFARTAIEGQRVVQRPFGEVQHPRTGKDVPPRPLGSTKAAADGPGDRRVALADWLTASDNPMFARAFVNRVWKELMGRGLVEPVDDLRPTNPPSNPALLDALAADFVRHGYNLRHLVRTITFSRTYQLSSQANEINRQDEQLFSRGYLKLLTGQVLADVIAQASGVTDEFAGYAPGTRAVELIDSQVPSYTLDVFGRCPRTTNCENPAQFGGGLSQALHLVNAPAVNAKTEAAMNRFLASTRSNRELLEELYLRTVSRSPDAKELNQWEDMLSKASSKREVLEDLFWALLNSREFAFNH